MFSYLMASIATSSELNQDSARRVYSEAQGAL